MLNLDITYLETVGKASYQRKVRLRLEYFFKFMSLQNIIIDDIFDIEQQTFQKYFAKINSLKASKNAKFRYVQNLKEYLDWIRRNRKISKRDCKLDLDDVFHKIQFRDTGSHRNEKPLYKEHVYDCLRYFREQNFEDYILWGLIATTSMRIGGAMNILIKNIHLDDRYIITDEKETEDLGKNNIYFITPKYKRSLESFILEIQQNRPEQEHLFRLQDKTYRLHLKKWEKSINKRMNLKLDVHPHLFRDAFNTEIFELGANEEQRCLILNQIPNGVNKQRYLKRLKQIEIRREIFDKYFPYYDFFN